MYSYQIFTDATADFCDSMLKNAAPIKIIPMQVEIGGKSYSYGPCGDISASKFYALQHQGNYAATSQINPEVYRQYFEPALKDGKNIMYLCFSSGMSGTIQSANICIEELRKEYPERKILCTDTLCASVGEGFLVCEAAKKQAAGYTFERLADWVISNRLKVCHWFTVDVFDHLKHGGRVSATTAAVGTMLGIKPLLHVDEGGRLEAVGKPRGIKQAIAAQLDRIENGWSPDICRRIVIGHGDNLTTAQQLKGEIVRKFPKADVYIADIGPIIGAHAGPGVVAVIYWGSNR